MPHISHISVEVSHARDTDRWEIDVRRIDEETRLEGESDSELR